jgi:MOSC domain-containing protein YiiM
MQSADEFISQDQSSGCLGHLVSVNVGVPRTVDWQGRCVTSAIWKQPVDGPIAIRGVNLAGDDQADRHVHGGPDKAVYAYGTSDYDFWTEQLGSDVVAPGLFGENLTVAGFDVSHSLIGERWQIGACILEVSQPRIPCYKLGMRLGDKAFPRRFAAAERPGAYLRIIREGIISAGDRVQVVHRPLHDLTPALVSRAYHSDRRLLPRLIEVPELALGWREWAQKLSAAH